MSHPPPEIKWKTSPIAQLQPQLQSVNCEFIIIEKTPSVGFLNKHGEYTTVRVADASGSVNLNVPTNDYGDCVMPGDICRLKNGHTTIFKGCMSLACGRNGELTKHGEFTMVYSEAPNMSEYSAEFAAAFPPPKRNDFLHDDGPTSTPTIGGPPRTVQPLMSLMQGPPPSLQSNSNAPRDPRSKRQFMPDSRH